MAEELDDGEFWLPPKFLSDQEDDLVMDLTRPNSDLSSSAESSDEDDYLLLGLTQRFWHQSSLSDNFSKPKNNKWSSTSPQSTLYNQGTSPNCTSPLLGNNKTPPYGLLYAAAGEVVKMRQVEQTNSFSNRAPTRPHSRPPNKPSLVFVPANISNQSVLYPQYQVNQLKQQQVMKQQKQGNLRRGQQQMSPHNRGKNASNGRLLGLPPSAWPTLQQSWQPPQLLLPGSGMIPVFLQNQGTKRQCSGTGVFLPRPVGTPTQTLNKPACLTVLVPDRVVKASKLNLKKNAAAQLHNRTYTNNASISSSDYAVKDQNRVVMAETQAQQKWNAAVSRPQAAPISNEVQLPQEWTY